MDTRLLIGLGNPGPQYDGTRHNVGIDAVRAWVGDSVDWKVDARISAEAALVTGYQSLATALFPLTGMNESGQAVATFLKNNPIETEHILIVHDELELALGDVKLKAGGSAKGHNGVRSIHQHLGTDDIPRLRLGIGRPPVGVTVHDFVLSRFTPDEQTQLGPLFEHAKEQIAEWIAS